MFLVNIAKYTLLNLRDVFIWISNPWKLYGKWQNILPILFSGHWWRMDCVFQESYRVTFLGKLTNYFCLVFLDFFFFLIWFLFLTLACFFLSRNVEETIWEIFKNKIWRKTGWSQWVRCICKNFFFKHLSFLKN